ncbi:hypothetical protein VNO78_16062 [Psophocarpus tetragonolobus]|uniref:TF-B3 domain-containing protein n=1 Tax=Psophocarpus tetragonolobus TaxID=3891 RepID=A0AAN9XKG2_PSOTE
MANQVTTLDRASSSFKTCNPFFLVIMQPSYAGPRFCLNFNLKVDTEMIPNKFVEIYGQGLPNTLFLKTPNGAEWKIILEKSNGKIWFQKGWKEFAEYHSLTHGHFLVFKYKRASYFQVQIFDLSALEIEYPSKRIKDKKANDNKGNKPPNDENLECPGPSRKRKANSTSECLQPYQMRRQNKKVKVENSLILPKKALHPTNTKCKEQSKAIANQVTAVDRASSFKPCNPFFLVVMRPSYIHSKGGPLTLPPKFCRKHFNSDKNRVFVNLQLLNGKVWPAKYLITNAISGTNYKLSSGWGQFVKDNNFNVGDVCIFELTDRTKLTFLVHIFRDIDASNCSTSQ